MSTLRLSEVGSNGAADTPLMGFDVPSLGVSSLTSPAVAHPAFGGGFSVTLPLPTSANRLWRRGKGGKSTHISPEYAAWKSDARASLRRMDLVPVFGPYRLLIEVSDRDKGDLDNRIKAVSDVLVSLQLTSDDRNAFEVTVRRNKQVHPRLCRVTVSPHLAAARGASVAGGTLDDLGDVGGANAAA